MKKIKLLSGILALCLAIGGFSSCELLSEEASSTSVESAPAVNAPASESESSSGSDSVEDSGSGENSSVEDSGSGENSAVEDIVVDGLSIHFLHFGNLISGDCTLIKVGDTEVLIDAGSTRGSVRTTVPYIQQYCTDGVLEYVVATHAHTDHISGFLGLEEKDRESPEDGRGVFESFECQTIIDYTGRKTTSAISKEYEAARDEEVKEHGGKHCTALECWNNVNGAQRSYSLGEGVTMNILYQKYYEQSTSNENNYSVCILISQEDNHYLFTGDLESGGEKSLVEKNKLPKCKLYKGGHHGSKTSSSTELLSVIQPEIVCVCSCCGDKNGFVHQEFIDNIAPYTDKVYVTTVISADGKKGESMNGNIVVTSDAEGISVACSNNDLLFKDTEWFKANRVLPPAWQTTGE